MLSVAVVIGALRVKGFVAEQPKNNWSHSYDAYITYPRYWDTLTPYHTCPKTWKSLFCHNSNKYLHVLM